MRGCACEGRGPLAAPSRLEPASTRLWRLLRGVVSCKMRYVARSDMPTAKVSPAPVVLCVGCAPALVKRCREAAIQGQALLVEADLTNAATLAAQTRPLVILLLEDVYRFDAASFSALAADVHARLVTIADDQMPQRELEDMVVAAIIESESMRDSFV